MLSVTLRSQLDSTSFVGVALEGRGATRRDGMYIVESQTQSVSQKRGVERDLTKKVRARCALLFQALFRIVCRQ